MQGTGYLVSIFGVFLLAGPALKAAEENRVMAICLALGMAASIAGTSPHTMESLAMFAHFYLQGRSPTDPVASPIFGSFEDFPPGSFR